MPRIAAAAKHIKRFAITSSLQFFDGRVSALHAQLGVLPLVGLIARGVPDSGEEHSDADARHNQTHQPRHDIEAVLPKIRNQLV